MPGIPPPFRALTEQPWALPRSVLQELVDAAATGSLPARAAMAQPAPPRREGIVSVITIRGVIEHHSTWMTDMFGGTSVDAIRASLREALAQPEVMGIVLDIDSPGGGVSGITELAAEIRGARGTKPILAIANTMAASAAYWLAAQADEVYVTPSGQAGSIGVYAVHEDISRALDQAGVTATIISAGKYKTEGNEFEPLSDDARDTMQHRCDVFYDQFVKDIASGRGITAAAVRSGYGEGRVLLAQDALAESLVDGIAALDAVIRQAGRASRAAAPRAEGGPAESHAESDDPDDALPFRTRVSHLVADADAVVTHAHARARLRRKEGRPPLSPSTEASLRSIRDAISALLEPADPDPVAAATRPAVQPPAPVAPVSPPRAALSHPRFRSREDWLHSLEVSAR